jgi:nitrous oxide reductase
MFHRETDDIVFNKLKKIEKNIIKKENKEITDD